jgi:hypothetical protein
MKNCKRLQIPPQAVVAHTGLSNSGDKKEMSINDSALFQLHFGTRDELCSYSTIEPSKEGCIGEVG